MTEEIYKTNHSFFDSRTKSAIYSANNFTPASIDDAPCQKRRVVTKWCSRLQDSGLPGSALAVEYLHAKYIRNLSISTIQQAGRVILYFLHFLTREGTAIYTLTRQNISAYAGYEQDRGLKMQSVANHLRSLYAFIVFLVDQDVLSPKVMERKIRIKLPAPLPWAIPSEDVKLLLQAITTVRDKAMLLLLLQTGMRVGELLAVKISDISFGERKILIYLGEKNFQGRAVYWGLGSKRTKSRHKFFTRPEHSPPRWAYNP